jgi:hypothetical protein
LEKSFEVDPAHRTGTKLLSPKSRPFWMVFADWRRDSKDSELTTCWPGQFGPIVSLYEVSALGKRGTATRWMSGMLGNTLLHMM